ncbi:MAG: hypothetical protein ACRDNE_02220 [Gaiellaceae bacterium]
MTDARLDLIRELEHADEEVAAVLAELDELYAATEAVRERALDLEGFFARVPAALAAAAEAVEKAERDVVTAEEAAERAAADLRAAEGAGDAERLAAARRFDVRARDSLAVARRRHDEALAERERLDAEAAEAERERPELVARAGGLATALRERQRLAADAGAEPGASLEDVSAWAAGARAALLVARSSLAAERDAVIRQANELGSLVLGEPLAPGATSAVARRVERALRDG